MLFWSRIQGAHQEPNSCQAFNFPENQYFSRKMLFWSRIGHFGVLEVNYFFKFRHFGRGFGVGGRVYGYKGIRV